MIKPLCMTGDFGSKSRLEMKVGDFFPIFYFRFEDRITGDTPAGVFKSA